MKGEEENEEERTPYACHAVRLVAYHRGE